MGENEEDSYRERTLRFQSWVKQRARRQGFRRKMMSSGENTLSLRSQWASDEMLSRYLMYRDILYKCTLSVIRA